MTSIYLENNDNASINTPNYTEPHSNDMPVEEQIYYNQTFLTHLEEENKKQKNSLLTPKSKSVFGAFKSEWMPEIYPRFDKLEQIIKKQKK